MLEMGAKNFCEKNLNKTRLFFYRFNQKWQRLHFSIKFFDCNRFRKFQNVFQNENRNPKNWFSYDPSRGNSKIGGHGSNNGKDKKIINNYFGLNRLRIAYNVL